MPSRAAHLQWSIEQQTGKKANALPPRLIKPISRAMPKISAYIIAYNEAAKIEAAVSSVLWADEVVVADSKSTDGTAALAEALGARIVQIPFSGFGFSDKKSF